VRQHGRDRLQRSGGTERVRNRHLAFFDLARRAEPELIGLRQASWLRALHLEYDNLLGARLEHVVGRSPAQGSIALDAAAALAWFWVKRGFLGEGRQWLGRAVEMAPGSSPSIRARAYIGLTNVAYFQGDFAGAAAYATSSVALGLEADDPFSVAFGLGLQTLVAAEAGDIATAMRLAGEARAAASAIGDTWTEGPALYFLGNLSIRNGDLDEASRLWEEARQRGPTRGRRHFRHV
jgi:ATP/maltotriose-dependent transcriptional regulator MalT